jgi:hypothetical protein
MAKGRIYPLIHKSEGGLLFRDLATCFPTFRRTGSTNSRRHRNDEHDPQGPNPMDGQRGRCCGSTVHRQTLSLSLPNSSQSSQFSSVGSKLRNETLGGDCSWATGLGSTVVNAYTFTITNATSFGLTPVGKTTVPAGGFHKMFLSANLRDCGGCQWVGQ